MDLSFEPEAEAFRLEVQQFARQELPSGWLGGGLEEEYSEEFWPLTQVTARRLGEKGWLTLGWPRAYGGQAASWQKVLVYQEETAYLGIPGTDMGVGGVAWIGPCLMLFGTEAQKREHLPQIAAGARFWCTAYSEPGSGSDLASLQCRATARGSGYIIQGQKIWTSAGHIADWCWLAARTDANAPKHQGISLFLADMRSQGVTVRPLIDTSGLHALNELFFDEVFIPGENRVGEENQGWYYMVTALNFERVWPGIRCAARARRIMDELVEYLRREQGRRPGALIQHRLAEMAVNIEAGRLLAYRLAWRQGRGDTPSHEASLVKVYTSELIHRVAQGAMTLLGLWGQAEGSPLVEWLRRSYLAAPGETILAGTSEIQRNIVASRGLGLPR